VTRRGANRRNAARSTGPRTARGKRRVRRNALKHGLASNALAPRICERKVDRLVKALVGTDRAPEFCDLARIFVFAELAWQRVQQVQRALLQAQPTQCRGALVAHPQLAAVHRYERRAANKRLRALSALDFPLHDKVD
jgi:hypothetical protein